jgi:hypothetical protein
MWTENLYSAYVTHTLFLLSLMKLEFCLPLRLVKLLAVMQAQRNAPLHWVSKRSVRLVNLKVPRLDMVQIGTLFKKIDCNVGQLYCSYIWRYSEGILRHIERRASSERHTYWND